MNLLNRMPATKYRHSIICLTDATEFRKRLERTDVEIYALHKRRGKDLMLHWRLWRLLRRLRPDMLHTRNLTTLEYVLTAALAGVRARVHGEHGWDGNDPGGQSRRYRLLRRLCNPLVDRFVTVSRDLHGWLTDQLQRSPDDVRQIYNGVDTELFRPGPERLPVTVPDGAVVIGLVARLDTIKDPVTLARAFAQLARTENVFLAVIGDGPLRDETEGEIRAAGLSERLWMPGARDDVPQLMRAFDVFALPSLNEGICNTILEAMATGLPVVATRVGGNPELVQEDRSGRLFEPGDAETLAAHLRDYVRDTSLRQRHGAAGRQRALVNFSMQAMVDAYQNLYDGLLTRAGD